MLGAAILAKNSKVKDDRDNKDHRDFLFMFSNTIFHEVSHIFTTYLTKGKEKTPPTMNAQVTGTVHKTEGESGRRLEQLVFGGTIYFWDDPVIGTPNDHVCTHILALIRGESAEP